MGHTTPRVESPKVKGYPNFIDDSHFFERKNGM
jgi:hypothetical protein